MPEIEEREAARYNGYRWEHWLRLHYHERVYGVAYFRARRQIEMHQQDAQERETKRQQDAARRKGRRG